MPLMLTEEGAQSRIDLVEIELPPAQKPSRGRLVQGGETGNGELPGVPDTGLPVGSRRECQPSRGGEVAAGHVDPDLVGEIALERFYPDVARVQVELGAEGFDSKLPPGRQETLLVQSEREINLA